MFREIGLIWRIPVDIYSDHITTHSIRFQQWSPATHKWITYRYSTEVLTLEIAFVRRSSPEFRYQQGSK